MAIVENKRIYIRNFILSPCVCVCVAKILIALMQWFNAGYEQAPNEQSHDIGKYIHVINSLKLRALKLHVWVCTKLYVWHNYGLLSFLLWFSLKKKTGEKFISVVANVNGTTLKIFRRSETNKYAMQAHHMPVDV